MMETSSKDKNIDKIPKENLREPDGEESNLLFTDEYKEALERHHMKLLEITQQLKYVDGLKNL